jgi:hypothetical protein
MRALSTGCSRAGVRQAVEKRPPAALRSLFVIAAYQKYASCLMIVRVLHPRAFEKPDLEHLTKFYSLRYTTVRSP